jgi:hypothetical protein
LILAFQTLSSSLKGSLVEPKQAPSSDAMSSPSDPVKGAEGPGLKKTGKKRKTAEGHDDDYYPNACEDG